MPHAVAVAIVGAIGLTGTVATVATFAISAGLTIAGAVAANALFGRKPPEMSPAQRDRTHVLRSAVAPMRVVYGTAKVSGPLVAAFSSGDDNKYLHLVIPLAGHEVEAITALFVDDEEVATAAGAEGWMLPATGRLAKTGANGTTTPGVIQWKLHFGTDTQAADPHLMVSAPSGQWTADHRLRGIAYLYAQLEWDPEKWTGIPNLAATVRGRKLFDPRTGTTVWSNNPALCIRDYLCADFGLNCDAGEIDDVSFIVAANLCDEPAALTPTTTQTRYTLDGVIFLDDTPITIMEQMLSACAGTLVYTGGRYRLFAGGTFAPVITLTGDDLRDAIRVRPHLPRAELFNGVKGTFIDPENYWQPGEFPPVRNPTYETEDGEAILRDVAFPFTTDRVRAQRLARIQLEKARQGMVVEFPAKLTALRVAVMEPVRLTIPELGWTGKTFIPLRWSLTADGGIDLTLREEAAAIYDWSHGHVTTYDLAAGTALRSPFTVGAPTAVTVTPFAELQPDGTTVPALRVSWTAARDAFVIRTEIQSRAGAAAAWDSRLVPAGTTGTVIAPVVSGRTYDVRIRSLNTIGASSVWVTPAAGIAPADTTPPAAPTGLTATGGLSQIALAWTNPADPDLRHIEVWVAEPLAGGAAPAVTDATRLAVVATNTCVHTGLSGLATRYYWVRGVDRTGNIGPWHGALGVSATTRLVRYSDLERRFIDTALLTDSLSAEVTSIATLAHSYTNLALEIASTGTTVAQIRTDVNTVTTTSSALASRIDTIQTTLSGNTATVQQTTNSLNGVRAEYMLKTQVESGGRRYVSGFGLVNELQGTTPVSEFMVLANRFAVGTPSVDGGTPQFPFLVVTDATGHAKVCMESAFIQEAAIDTAHIRTAAICPLRGAVTRCGWPGKRSPSPVPSPN